MAAETKNRTAGSPPRRPDSFAKTRTFPEKWDISAFQTPDQASQNGREPVDVNSARPSDPAIHDDGSDWQIDPFPEPRTFPSKWHVSAFS